MISKEEIFQVQEFDVSLLLRKLKFEDIFCFFFLINEVCAFFKLLMQHIVFELF